MLHGKENLKLMKMMIFNEINNLVKPISGRSIFDNTEFVATSQNCTPRLVSSEKHDFAKGIVVVAAGMQVRIWVQQQQYT